MHVKGGSPVALLFTPDFRFPVSGVSRRFQLTLFPPPR